MRVLIVIHDFELRMSLAGRLRRAELDVLTACNESEAMTAIAAALFGRPEPEIDLVITDVAGGQGVGLAAALGHPRRCIAWLPLAAERREPQVALQSAKIDELVELASTIAQYGRLGQA